MKTFRQLSEIIMPQVKNDLNGMDKMSFVKKHGVTKSVAKQRLATEAKDEQEYGYEGDMALNQLATLIRCGEMIRDMLKPDTDLPEWVQSKITLSTDYIQTAADYLYSEMNESTSAAVRMQRALEKIKQSREASEKRAQELLKPKSKNEEVELDEVSTDGYHAAAVKSRMGAAVKVMSSMGSDKQAKTKLDARNAGLKRLSDRTSAEMKKANSGPQKSTPSKTPTEAERRGYGQGRYMGDSVEIDGNQINEARPSQRHPLEGHEYHKKSDEALVHIAKDAHKAAEAMKSHNTDAENKYRDQANDSATVRHFRKTSGMPDWYKKKYGHMNEQMDCNQSKSGVNCSVHGMKDCTPGQMKEAFKTMDEPNYNNSIQARQKKADDDKPPFDGPYKKTTGVVTDKSGAKHGGMSIARHLARMAARKQANVKESNEPLQESRKAEIVREAMKVAKEKKKNNSEDKFIADPELNSKVIKVTSQM